YLLDKIKKNGKTSVTTLTSRSISGTMSAGLASVPNAHIASEITGDLVVNNTTCDLQASIFVQGNLTINPDLTITNPPLATPATNQNYNGCMYIVKGNVVINGGSNKTPTIATGSATLASYDVVNASIVTDGTFSTPVDTIIDNGQGTWSPGVAGGLAKYGYG